MRNIFVFGATGNIGTALLKQLQGKGVHVFAGIRNINQKTDIEDLGAKAVEIDFNNQESLNHALKDIDKVFLVTPLMQNPEHVTEAVLQACELNGVKHLVRSTAAGADSNGAIQMARWAGKSEDLIKASGIEYTLIQPNNFLQNFINFHSHTITSEHAFYAPNGDAKLGMVDVNDIAEVAMLALTTDLHINKTYTLSGLALTNTEYATLLSNVLGKSVTYVDVPEKAARESMLANDLPEWLVDAMMELNSIMKQGWTAEYSEDFKQITGREYTSAQTFFENNKRHFI